MNEKIKDCTNCFYFQTTVLYGRVKISHECLRYPPVPSIDGKGSYFPVLLTMVPCGEFKKRPKF